MDDKKITDLPAASALTGDEQFELVQGGASKRGTLSNLPTSTATATAINAALPRRVSSNYVSGTRTITATPALLNADGTDLLNRRWLIVRNESTDTRMRYGVAQSNLQRDGEVIEPQAVAFIELDPAAATAVYGCSEGRAIAANIGEDVA